MNKKTEDINIRRFELFHFRLIKAVVRDSTPFAVRCARTANPITFEKRLKLDYGDLRIGDIWGKRWDSGWMHLTGTIPEGWQGKTVVAQIDVGGEGLVFRPDGTILQGITNGSVFDTEFGRDIVPLVDACDGGENVELWVESAANGLFGMFCDLDPGPDSTNRYGQYDAKLNQARLAVFDTDIWQLMLDVRVLLGLIKALPPASVRRARIIQIAVEAMNAFGKSNNNPRFAREILARELGKPANASALSVTAIGHAHIDTAWLWPVRETIRKCARTFATQLDLIERYPEYIFGASQPQHYVFIKEYYPELYKRIKAAIAAGRWEVQGCMWVESDCNVTSGESLVRQVLHGKNFFMDEFGVDVDNLWLPDVFGYSAALPQILEKSGVKYFLTQKLSWSQINEFPHHTFIWEGIDGTRVLTHFPPENTYNSQLASDTLVAASERFHEKEYIDEFISLFGVGDGGGGPKAEHIEMGRRQSNLEGACRVQFGPACDFLRRLERYRDRLPVWVGELYLELHRGTLTTQAKVKRANRKLEHQLRAIEMLASCLPLENYPQKSIDAIWKTVLLNQFHDIIPGSSITEVYRVTHEQHRDALDRCDRIIKEVSALLGKPDENCITLFNSLHYTYDGAIELPESWENAGVEDENGKALTCQSEGDKTIARVVVPPYSFYTLIRSDTAPIDVAKEDSLVLENDVVRYEFDRQGQLIRAYDKESEREIIDPTQPGNIFTLYEDYPNAWDAWDIDVFYRDVPLETATALQVTPLCTGSVRSELKLEFRIGQSSIVQHISLSKASKRLDFETHIDWKEKHTMLRVAFPVTIHADEAAFDIQYGYLRRSTHRNTSWEQAKFEVVGHRYADLSDADYGVALLNDCKYGYFIENGLLDLNLLRSANYPDPDADQGEHDFTFSLLPHSGDLRHSNVIAEAAQLNQGIVMIEGFRAGDGCELPVTLSGKGVSLEVVKKAEKESCWVIRIVETIGCAATANLSIGLSGATLQETDLMEWHDTATYTDDNIAIPLKPFEIRTFKLRQ
ncbi:MAG: glycoside hydrolase family 38 C-terminal domain-containing protein [Candidatus Zixiibacteriota bacterium]